MTDVSQDKMGTNWIGLYTMVRREVSRMMRVPIQAFIAPWISALLFIFIFGFVVGGRITEIGGHRYLEFVLPGIVMMNVVNAAFLQSSSAIYFARFIKFIEETLVAPLSYAEMIAGSLSVVVLRASVTGVGIMFMGMFFNATHIESWLMFLFWILTVLVINGFGAIDLDFFTHTTPAPGSEGGGLLNPIVGSLMMVGTATLISTPIGIFAGIYLAEYGEESRFAQITRFVTDVMLSAPSIVIGLFIYAIYVANVRHFSGWAGSFAIALIAIPVVVRTTDNMLVLVPSSLREAAFALGAPRWKVATMVRLRAVKAGVLTGVLLAVARISGETAPLLFTALNNQFFSADMNTPLANLPVVIFQFAMSPYDNWRQLAWGGALLITFSVLGLNILSRLIASAGQKKG